MIDFQKLVIGEEKSAIDDKKSAVDMIKSAIEQQRYNRTLKANILKEYDEIEKNEYSKVGLNLVSRDLKLSETLWYSKMRYPRDLEVNYKVVVSRQSHF